MKYIPSFILVILILVLQSCGSENQNYDVVIESANIIDTGTGEITENQSIGILGDSIAVIAEAGSSNTWKSKRTVDASGKFVIPGLWNMHVHFGGGDTLISENKNLLPMYIANGITTVRDCSADLSPKVIEWKNKIANGELLGPNIFTSGPKIEGVNSIWPGDQEIANEEELGLALDSLKTIQVDFVKITDNALNPQLFEKAVKASHKRGYKVSAHIPFGLRAVDLSKEGLSTVEHMSYMLKAGSPKERSIIKEVDSGNLNYTDAQAELYDSFDPKYALTVYEKLAKNHTAVVPTLIGNKIISYIDENDHHNDPQLKYLGKGLLKTYQWRVNRANKATKDQIVKRKKRYAKLVSLLPIIKASGMDIIAGTDAGFLNSYIYPGFALHEELEIYSEGGLTPLEALRSSVVNGPKFFDLLDKYGSVEPGKKADLLLLNSNPLLDIEATRNIHVLLRDGKVFTKSDLEGLLNELEKKK